MDGTICIESIMKPLGVVRDMMDTDHIETFMFMFFSVPIIIYGCF